MKNQIQITGAYSKVEVVSIDELRNRINDRRKRALNPRNKRTERPTALQQNSDSLQPAAHYASFEIAQMNHEKAIQVYNAGGVQKAKLI